MAKATSNSDSTSGSAQTHLSSYVVQRRNVSEVAAFPDVWEDVATITAPPRTKRATIIGRALREAGLLPTSDKPLEVRVLDARSAHVTTVGLKQRDPEIELS